LIYIRLTGGIQIAVIIFLQIFFFIFLKFKTEHFSANRSISGHS
jgi:hypothetical protein